MIVDAAAFLGVCLLVIVTPGQDTALTVRNTLLGGRHGGISTAFGVSMGQAVWTVAASAGLTALLLASAPLFFALKMAGAIYLVYLGALALRDAVRPSAELRDQAQNPNPGHLAPLSAFRQGFVSNLGNPKMAVFFTSLLPQFARRDDTSFFVLLLLGLIFCTLTFVWLTGYAIVIARAGDFLRRSTIRRTFDAVMGTVFVALGLRLAAAQH